MSAAASTTHVRSASGHRVVSREEWLDARQQHLLKEKELTRQRDRLSAERRELPWVRVDKQYVFETPAGRKTLEQLFDGRRQLIVYHFMWRHDLGDACIGCSFLADHIDGANLHLPHNDVSLVVVSRAPLQTLQSYRQRMGWRFDWISSDGSDFNYDYHASFTAEQLSQGKVYYNYRLTESPIEELSGLSVFYRDDAGQIFHTYSSYSRGSEEVLGTYMFLDLTPQGRNEHGPNFSMIDWLRHHDRYGVDGHVDPTGGFHPRESQDACCAEKAGP
jgi:predicted dithiol-disulfide oxidoreductase (DUF899 family)